MNDVMDGRGAGRLRTLGRVVVFWGGYLAILLGMAMVKAKAPPQWGQLVWGLTSSVALLPLTLVFLRRDGRRFRDVGLNVGAMTVPRFAAGCLIGLAVYGSNVLIAAAVGPVHVTRAGAADPGALALVVGTIMALACMEELGFRGYALRTLVPSVGLWPAQAVVAGAFGLCHLAFGWSWANVLLGVVPAALVFGMAAVASRGLAMPVGIHAALNFSQWAAGGTGGLWTITVDEEARARVGAVAPFTGVAVTLAATAALWRWHLSRQGRGCEGPVRPIARGDAT
jgi:uncharacterized protein